MSNLPNNSSSPKSATLHNDRSRFRSGQTVVHTRLGYRGVVVSVDDEFQSGKSSLSPKSPILTEKARKSRWYHLLVHGSTQETYVVESQLERDPSARPIEHPLVPIFWDDFEDGEYIRDRVMN